MSSDALPVHGFVLAGGKSSRMGQDKARLTFLGHSMVGIAVQKLKSFCSNVSIAGNREDLNEIAPVVSDTRFEAGPGGGIEAGLRSSLQPWALFLPVDVPLVPALLLRNWAAQVLAGQTRKEVKLSSLRVQALRQPTFCLADVRCAEPVRVAMERGERKLGILFDEIASVFGPESMSWEDATQFAAHADASPDVMEMWFKNLNTPADLLAAEAWAGQAGVLSHKCGKEVGLG